MPVCLGYFLLQSCAALAFEQREHRGLARSLALLGRGRVVRTGGLLGVAFDWAGASAAAVRATFAGFVAIAFSCWARSMSCSAIFISSSSVSPRRWAAFQIRATALLRSVKRLTSFSSAKGGAPAKPFQTSTRRLAGQAAMASLKSASVSKAAPVGPASLVAAPLSGCTARLLSPSRRMWACAVPWRGQVRSCAVRLITSPAGFCLGLFRLRFWNLQPKLTLTSRGSIPLGLVRRQRKLDCTSSILLPTGEPARKDATQGLQAQRL